MQEETRALNVIYEARRQARGPEPPPAPRRWRRRLLLWSAGILAVAGVPAVFYLRWSLSRVNTAQASVRAALVDLSAGADARVVEMCVRPGDTVAAGTFLARLDDAPARAALAAAEAERALRASRAAQAQTQLAITRARVEAQIELARRRVEIAQAAVAAARAELRLQQARFPAEVAAAEAERDAALAAFHLLRDGARAEEIEAARLRLANERALEKLYATELSHTEKLFERQYDSLYNLEAARTKLQTQCNRVREAELDLARLEAGPRPAELERSRSLVAGREAEVALARTEQQREELLRSTLSMRESELRQAEAELKRAEAAPLEVALAEEQARAAQAELQKAEAELEGQRRAIEAHALVSPVAGTVIRTFHRPGEMCRKGETLVQVADDTAGRWVEGFVRERDAVRVKIGQRARIEVFGTGGKFRAVVQAVGLATAPLSRAEAASASAAASSGSPTYVWVRLRPDAPMDGALPGMTARAIIIVR